jgi:hypothetical protein
MPSTVITIDQAEVRFGPKADPLVAVDFSCQVTRAEITSTSNTTTTSIPATFCSPASERSVPVASTFQLNLEFLQDWTDAAGLSAYLFQNDATEVGFEMYLEGATDPSATGVVIAQAGGFGGVPGQPLVSSVVLNIQGYPTILNSAGASIRPVTPPPVVVDAPIPADY